MNLTDEEGRDLKAWIIKKLENISDADSDVLADYVLALIRADTSEQELKANAIENLEDFLRENTASFVDEIFHAIHTKSYVPGYVAPSVPTIPQNLPIPTGPMSTHSPSNSKSANGYSNGQQQSRKRSYNESQDGTKGNDFHYGQNDRQMKHIRRGGANNGGRGTFQAQGRDFASHQSLPGMPPSGPMSFPGISRGPSALPFDPNDPVAAMIAMQALGMPLAGLPGTGSSPNFVQAGAKINTSGASGKNRIDARCRDYDTKGFCLRGIACPFNHGDNQVVVPGQSEEYDPNNASMIDVPPSQVAANGHTDNFRGRGRGRGRGDRGAHTTPRRNRAEFSQAGPNHDKSITTVVVEQIPEENFDEAQVRDFFSAFGNIEEVSMQAYKRLALVKFDSYYSARAAYDSPKVIFDNRFVKVYWHNPNTAPVLPGSAGKASSPNSATTPVEPTFDREKFARDSEAAQMKLEERKALQQKNEEMLADIAKQKEELAQKQAEEKRRLQEKLKAKGRPVSEDLHSDEVTTGDEPRKPSSNTEALRAQLKALEDEAKSLGIDPERIPLEPWSPARGHGRGRGRGSYRGWEGFAGRGGYDPARASYRGRGSFRGATRAGGAYNLDNRPKKVKVEGVVFDDAKDESLRQFLFSVGEFISIDSTANKSSQIVSFKDRFTAEKFFYGPKDIPGVGTVEFSWISSPLLPIGPLQSPTTDRDGDADMGVGDALGGNQSRDGGGGKGAEESHHEVREMDYDVAEDEDWIT